WKHQFGGAMRQAGIIAAGALHALKHHIPRLAEDHAKAQFLAQGLAEIDGIHVEPAETNMIYFDVAALGVTAEWFDQLLLEKGVRVSAAGPYRLRAVTHLDVSRSQVVEALDIIRELVKGVTGTGLDPA
ncbi:MAG: beta-eliminating lyase-related protein, partial [Anaerolineae bacterium]